jgi:hypothetical protein
MDLGAVIDAYWEYFGRSRDRARTERLSADEFFWAWEAVEDLMHDDEIVERQLDVDRVGLLVALADRAPGQAALAYLGAGPIENLLKYYEPSIDAIDQAALRNESVRIALRCAWFDNHIAPADAQRLRRYGPPL